MTSSGMPLGDISGSLLCFNCNQALIQSNSTYCTRAARILPTHGNELFELLRPDEPDVDQSILHANQLSIVMAD